MAYGMCQMDTRVSSILQDITQSEALLNQLILKNGGNLNTGLPNVDLTSIFGASPAQTQFPTPTLCLNPMPTFNEQSYIAVNSDVAKAVADSELKSGYEHYIRSGQNEERNPAGNAVSNPSPDINMPVFDLSKILAPEPSFNVVPKSDYIDFSKGV